VVKKFETLDSVDLEPPGSLEISLSQPGGTLNGIVKDRGGRPAVDSLVLLMPADPELVNSNLYRTAHTNLDGGFSIRGISPGDYGILAINTLEIGTERSREFRDEFDSRILKSKSGPSTKLPNSGRPELSLNPSGHLTQFDTQKIESM
jgi:hypothetical protein